MTAAQGTGNGDLLALHFSNSNHNHRVRWEVLIPPDEFERLLRQMLNTDRTATERAIAAVHASDEIGG